MAAAGAHISGGTVEQVFQDFRARRSALLKAFTSEFEEFYNQCRPDEEHLCLYGHPNGKWEVTSPVEYVPTDLPEPALAINLARDGMVKEDWLAFVALHSDAWLFSVAFHLGTKCRFDKFDRNRLFEMINGFPTLFDVVTGASKEQAEEESSSVSKHTTRRSKSNSKKRKNAIVDANDEDDDNKCSACGKDYDSDASDELWICCDICDKWFHGKCVKIKPVKAKHIKQYHCPSCTNERARN